MRTWGKVNCTGSCVKQEITHKYAKPTEASMFVYTWSETGELAGADAKPPQKQVKGAKRTTFYLLKKLNLAPGIH